MSLNVDVSAQHLLVALYGGPETKGSLLAITRGQTAAVIGRGNDCVRWVGRLWSRTSTRQEWGTR